MGWDRDGVWVKEEFQGREGDRVRKRGRGRRGEGTDDRVPSTGPSDYVRS